MPTVEYGSWRAVQFPPDGHTPTQAHQGPVVILLVEKDMPLLPILALFLAWPAQAGEKCALSGTVVNSVTGQPLNKVELELTPVDREATHVAVTTSDEKGRFAMVDLEPGRYHLHGQRNGYLDVPYGARRAGGDGTTVQLEGGQALEGLEFKLIPAGVIAGTIRDGDGEPLEDAVVTIARFKHEYSRDDVQDSDTANTDDRGEYRFRGLAPGKYYIGAERKPGGWDKVDHSANAGPSETSVPSFYPGVADASLATPISVSEGAQVEGIDIRLLRSRVFRVSGRVVNAPASGRLNVILSDPRNAGMTNYSLRTSTKNAAGDFELRGVPPGSYMLIVMGPRTRGRVAVEVGAADVDHVSVTLTAGADIKGRVIVEGEKKPGGLSFAFIANGDGYSGQVAEDGTFTVANLVPDHYVVSLWGLPRGFYCKSGRAGETDVLTDGLTVTAAGVPPLEVVIASDGGLLKGVVLDINQQPVAGATILLAPDRRSRLDLFKSTTSDQHGHYEVASIAPGDYKLFAWEDVEAEAWLEADFLKDYEKQGQKITLQPTARVAVDLSLATRPHAQ